MPITFKVLIKFACSAILLCDACLAQQVEPENIPEAVMSVAYDKSFRQTYVIDGAMNPFYLRGDFDGDNKMDYALWIKSRSRNETGIAIWLSTVNKFVILGAGMSFSVSGMPPTRDLSFLNTWQVVAKSKVERGVGEGSPPKLLGECILAGKRESANGLIYWNGKSFVWYQQAD